VAPQSGAKIFFYVLFTTLFKIQTVKLKEHLKIGWKKIAEDRVRSQNECMSDLSVIFLLYKGENYV
jgi:hypothetical protein